jgi:hypothetical protein
LPYEAAPYEAPYDDAPTVAFSAIEPPAPDPEPPHSNGPVAEKLAEPRPAIGASGAAQPSPEGEHPTHL